VGSFGVIEVISLHSANVLGACEGGVVCTDSDDLAAHVRNTRSSYGMGPPVPVSKTGNGRMSEAQAALALFNLDHYPAYQQRNEDLFRRVQNGLAGIPGLEVRAPSGVSQSNHQNLICLVDEATFGLRRDDLWQILRAENILAGRGFYPRLYRSYEATPASPMDDLQHTKHYSARTIEIPMNQALLYQDAAKLIDLIDSVQRNAGMIRHRLAEAA
jgi:dTDP-4-amino-4,6-dideoxygalactose transaminase